MYTYVQSMYICLPGHLHFNKHTGSQTNVPRVGTWGGSVPRLQKPHAPQVRESETSGHLKWKLHRTGQFCLGNFSLKF